jgi:hypothetical protein
VPGVREARLTATSPRDGRVPVVIVAQPGRDRDDLLGRETTRGAPRLLRAWQRRPWMAHRFRTLKHVLATEACHVLTEDADYGHVIVRLLAGLVLRSTARVLFTGRVTRAARLFSGKHAWRCLASACVACQPLSGDLRVQAA